MTPDKFTLSEFFLDVGQGHSLYVQDWGNPKALPIINVHGGPGSGSDNRSKAKFDPSSQRVIFYDQRGSGKSSPLGSLEHNTTADLIEDINKIAEKLKLTKFILSGGSWGALLSLAYALEHPDKVAGLVLSGVLTGSHDEINWLEHGRFVNHFPDAWERFLAATPKKHHSNPSAYHAAHALGGNQKAAKLSAYAYECLEGSIMKLDDRYVAPDFETYDPRAIKVEMYYMLNKCFLPDKYILDKADQLTMPVWLVQGRYDMVCPPITAYNLHKRLPNSRLIWTINGHRSDHEATNIINLAHLQLSGQL